jgi:hypothetical protein
LAWFSDHRFSHSRGLRIAILLNRYAKARDEAEARIKQDQVAAQQRKADMIRPNDAALGDQ